jgi:protein-S-isoprenylcysteine O-methyltransferase Ste14
MFQSLEHRVPPLAAVVIAGLLMYALNQIWPGFAVAPSLRLAVALPLVVLGILVCLAGVSAFRRAGTTVNPLDPDKVSQLVVTGIYRFTRHPMYLGMTFVLIGWACWLANPLTLAPVAAFAAFIERFQMQPEERALADRFPEQFPAYAARVRRWI